MDPVRHGHATQARKIIFPISSTRFQRNPLRSTTSPPRRRLPPDAGSMRLPASSLRHRLALAAAFVGHTFAVLPASPWRRPRTRWWTMQSATPGHRAGSGWS